MLKKKIFFNSLKYGTMCVALMVTGFLIVTFQEVSLKMDEIKLRKAQSTLGESRLEEGTIVNKKNLESLLAFSKIDQTVESWLTDNSDALVVQRNNYLVNSEIKIPELLSNNCSRYRCYQNSVDFEEIPSSLWKGLIGIEDYRFLDHEGIDYISILRAIIADIKAMKLVQGGSTLTQQLVKNLFLTNEKKFSRKLKEIVYAVYIESKLKKDEIITLYFNEVFWGTIGGVYLKGINAAAIGYFDKKPKQLNDYESAILIGLLKGPYFYHPTKHTERLKQRTKVVYNRLKSLNLITSKESQIWSEQQWSEWIEKLKEKDNSSRTKSIYLVTKNTDKLFDSFDKLTFYESIAKVKQGLKERTGDLDVAVKFLAIDSKCTERYCPNTFYHYSKVERDRNKAIFEEKHQVGSVLKPIIYEQFLNFGKTLNDKVSTKPITLKLVSGDWSPKDASKVHEDFISLRYAIQKSKNIPLVRTANEIGFEKLEPVLKDYFPELLVPLSEYPAQLLGAIELSLGDLSLAYLKYFRKTCNNIQNGLYKYEDSILFELSSASDTTISRVANKTIKQIMMFGKTGTTNSGLDNWYIAFDGKTFYATWFGVDSDRKDKKLRLSGASSAFRIFQNFLQYRGKQIYELYCSEKTI